MTFLFFLKKLISVLLQPTVWALLLGVKGLLLQLGGWRRSGMALVAVALMLLLAAHLGPLAGAISRPLEWQYPPFEQWRAEHPEQARALKYVVVLSAGSVADERLPATAQLQTITLARLVEGVRIWRELPQSRLLVSGRNASSPVSHARIMARAAVELGVPREQVLVEEVSLDTAAQAREIRAMVGDEPFVLVTSANHMPRSMGLMFGQGLQPIPAPTEYGSKSPPRSSWMDWIPGVSAIDRLYRAVHEYIGFWWAAMRGQIVVPGGGDELDANGVNPVLAPEN